MLYYLSASIVFFTMSRCPFFNFFVFYIFFFLFHFILIAHTSISRVRYIFCKACKTFCRVYFFDTFFGWNIYARSAKCNKKKNLVETTRSRKKKNYNNHDKKSLIFHRAIFGETIIQYRLYSYKHVRRVFSKMVFIILILFNFSSIYAILRPLSVKLRLLLSSLYQ